MTSPAPSYDPAQMGHSFEDELARLRMQVELSWSAEQRRLATLGVMDGQTVLDLGCGPGFFAERLSDWLPDARIIGLDAADRMCDVARVTLNRHILLDRAVVVQASAADTGLARGSVDVAISRYLYQHLDDPLAAAREVRRVLRPGGRHIIVEVDDGLWGLAEPSFPRFEGWHGIRANAQQERGGDRFRGRRLGRLLRQAGYDRVHLDVFSYNSDETGLQGFESHLNPEQFLPLVASGRMSLFDYLTAQTLFKQFMQSVDPFLLSIGFIADGEAPS